MSSFLTEHSDWQVGDVIFRAPSAADFPKGNHDELIHSIREKLFRSVITFSSFLDMEPDSTFGRERATNPFVADTQFG